MITASGLARLRACPGSAVLPRAENHNEWADAGHDEHETLAGELADGDLPGWIAGRVPAGARSEVALGYDVATGRGRIIGENLSRNYGDVGDDEIVGATDVLGIDGDAVVVIDWKTGFNDVEPAATNAQLWFYALAACRALGKSRAIIRIVYTKSERVDEAEAGPLELAEFASSLATLHRRVVAARAAYKPGLPVETREGPWCRHCGSKSSCGSKMGLLVQVAEKGLAVIGDTTMTLDRAREAYREIERIEQLVKDARKRLEVYVDDNGPIDLGGGRFFGRYRRPGNERVDGVVARRAIREVIPGDEIGKFEEVALEVSTSKAAIERAAKLVAGPKRGAATKLARSVVEKVRELGGVTATDTFPLGEFSGESRAATKEPVDTDAVDKLLAAAS